MDRRKFLESVCKAGAGILVAGSVIDLATVASARVSSRRGALDVREVPINLTDTPELKQVGGAYHLTVDDLEREILVVHSSPNKYTAVDIKCTHRGCDINYEVKAKKFVCPCHGSEFDLSGSVLKGPAAKPLGYYYAELKGDEVIVTVYGPNDKPPANAAPPVDSTRREASADSTGFGASDSTKH